MGRLDRAGRRRRIAWLGAAATVVVLLAVGAVTGTESGPTTPEATGSAASPGASAGASGGSSDDGSSGDAAAEVDPSPPPIPGPSPPGVEASVTHGRSDAPVTIVEFADFQCPKCGEFARETRPALVREYVHTGVVRFVWRDFPTFGKQSEAAVAARAAARQGRFWRFHDVLYGRDLPPRSGKLTDSYLRGVADDSGLDVKRFDADRGDRALRRAVDADFAFGQALGVPGTPAFLINGEPLFGAQPPQQFERAIQRARQQAGAES